MKLSDKLVFGNRQINNRVVFQPMEGCDCNTDGTPSEFTKEKYRSFMKSKAGIVWFEANAVCEEGRTNPHQMMLTKENLPSFRAFVQELKELALRENDFVPLMLIQLTHSGRQSVNPIIAYRNPVYEEKRPVR
ncbi:MAG: flavin oxidoreductase/NADH oxidase, partial [Clostridiales bacterium]|nr:flavin oxidoreductase/NADH oxidase [Clostridiales bacterium]